MEPSTHTPRKFLGLPSRRAGIVALAALAIAIGVAAYLCPVVFPATHGPQPPHVPETAISPEDEARIDAEVRRIREVANTHIPTGTDLPAFYSSLGDDGTAWRKILAMGSQAREMLTGREDSMESRAAIGAEEAIRGYVSQLEMALPKSVLSLQRHEFHHLYQALSSPLAGLNEIELPRRIYMIGEIQGAGFDNPDGERMLPVLHGLRHISNQAMIALVLLKNPEFNDNRSLSLRTNVTGDAAFHLRRSYGLMFSLVPVLAIDAILLSGKRAEMCKLLYAMVRNGLIEGELADELTELVARSPMDIRHIAARELLHSINFLEKDPLAKAHIANEVKFASLLGEPKSAFDVVASVIRGMSAVVPCVDAGNPASRVFRSPNGMTVMSDLDAACRAWGTVLGSLVVRSARESACLNMVNPLMYPLPILSGKAEFRPQSTASPVPYPSFRDAVAAGLGLFRASGRYVSDSSDGSRVPYEWAAVCIHPGSVLHHLVKGNPPDMQDLEVLVPFSLVGSVMSGDAVGLADPSLSLTFTGKWHPVWASGRYVKGDPESASLEPIGSELVIGEVVKDLNRAWPLMVEFRYAKNG